MTKSRRLYPTAEQKRLFRRWLGTARFVYNQTLAYLKTLRAKSVRALLTWAHSKFKKRLKGVAEQSCTIIIEVSEAYTSKTCSWSGEVVNVGSNEIIRGTDGIQMHRDVNSARGIFLRALAELPSLESFQRALVSNAAKSAAFSS